MDAANTGAGLPDGSQAGRTDEGAGSGSGPEQGARYVRVEYFGATLRTLSGHARRWYSQGLADALRRGRWHAVSIGEDYDPSSDYWLKGQRPSVPMILQARCAPLRGSGVPGATVWLGRSSYERVLASLRDDSREAWWDWCRPRRDRMGRPVDAPALYRSAGARVVAGEYSGRLEQQVALRFLEVATVVALVEVTPHRRS